METLTFKLHMRTSLTSRDKDRMFALMDANYNRMDRSVFESDLFKKDYVGLIYDEKDIIQGFTTFAVNPGGTGNEVYQVIFSGDTVISPEHWGTQVMMRMWCLTVGSIIGTDMSKKWYWYLLSKGHRTYLYLPFFFKTYYPSPEQHERSKEYHLIADDVSKALYPDYWNPSKGVIEFDNSMGELVPELADATYKKANSTFVKFFLTQNPNFYKGNELVCITEISLENTIRAAHTVIKEGIAHSILPHEVE